MSILKIPPHVLQHIIPFMPLSEVFQNLSRVCRQFYHVFLYINNAHCVIVTQTNYTYLKSRINPSSVHTLVVGSRKSNTYVTEAMRDFLFQFTRVKLVYVAPRCDPKSRMLIDYVRDIQKTSQEFMGFATSVETLEKFTTPTELIMYKVADLRVTNGIGARLLSLFATTLCKLQIVEQGLDQQETSLLQVLHLLKHLKRLDSLHVEEAHTRIVARMEASELMAVEFPCTLTYLSLLCQHDWANTFLSLSRARQIVVCLVHNTSRTRLIQTGCIQVLRSDFNLKHLCLNILMHQPQEVDIDSLFIEELQLNFVYEPLRGKQYLPRLKGVENCRLVQFCKNKSVDVMLTNVLEFWNGDVWSIAKAPEKSRMEYLYIEMESMSYELLQNLERLKKKWSHLHIVVNKKIIENHRADVDQMSTDVTNLMSLLNLPKSSVSTKTAPLKKV